MGCLDRQRQRHWIPVERCQGAGCTNFAQVATVSGTRTSYKDAGLAASTSYSYRVRATDGAGNFSPYSNTASATTPAPDTTPPTQPGTLTASAVSSAEVDLAWGAATDNVGVTSYLVERCQSASCTNFTRSAPRQAPATRTPASAPTPPTTTASAPPTRPATWAPTQTPPPPPRRPRRRGSWRPTGLTRGRGRRSPMRQGMETAGRSRARRGRPRASTGGRCSSTAPVRWSPSPTPRRCTCPVG